MGIHRNNDIALPPIGRKICPTLAFILGNKRRNIRLLLLRLKIIAKNIPLFHVQCTLEYNRNKTLAFTLEKNRKKYPISTSHSDIIDLVVCKYVYAHIK